MKNYNEQKEKNCKEVIVDGVKFVAKDEEFSGFDREPEISYTITGQQPFKPIAGDCFSEEVRAYTFKKAIEKAEIFSKKYHDVYIAKQFEYVYQMR